MIRPHSAGNSASRDLAQLGRALALGVSGRRFESCNPDNDLKAVILSLK